MISDRLSFRLLPAWAVVLALAACSSEVQRPEPVRLVRTTVVAAVAAPVSQDYAADIRARTETRLGFRVGGKLVARSVEVGQRVKPGEVLARLDAEDLSLTQEAARAALQGAQVGHDLAQADYRRFKDLRDQGFISSAELDRREATLKSAAAQLEQARAQAAVQANQAGHTVLKAPAAGVVVAVEAEPGAVLAAGTPVLRLAVDGPRDAVFAVPEDAVPAMRGWLGRKGGVRVRLWAGGEDLSATVREIAAAADPVTRTFVVKAELASDSAQIGQTATVRIDAPPAASVLTLPLAAVREHQGRSAVWVVDPSGPKVRLRPVVLGGAMGNDVVVASGLKPGERVVTAGVHVLTEGQGVRLQPDAAAAAAPSAASR